MFYQVTAECIVTSFLFGLLLDPFILHVAPVSNPDYCGKWVLGGTGIDPYEPKKKKTEILSLKKLKENEKAGA